MELFSASRMLLWSPAGAEMTELAPGDPSPTESGDPHACETARRSAGPGLDTEDSAVMGGSSAPALRGQLAAGSECRAMSG